MRFSFHRVVRPLLDQRRYLRLQHAIEGDMSDDSFLVRCWRRHRRDRELLRQGATASVPVDVVEAEMQRPCRP